MRCDVMQAAMPYACDGCSVVVLGLRCAGRSAVLCCGVVRCGAVWCGCGVVRVRWWAALAAGPDELGKFGWRAGPALYM